MEREVLSLYELTTLVREVVNYSFDDSYWIKAEIVRINENASGHCYLELAERSEHTDTLIAQCRAIIWRNIYGSILSYFHSITQRYLETGMKILFRARVEFHQVYGFSLHIQEIDPHYTLGEMVARKMQIIAQLKQEGIFDMNRQLSFPLVPQRIAVISSKTAAGYNDFVKHMLDNPYQYKYHLHFFQATMQGERAEQSIISALEKIFHKADHFDVVVIIRGGGSQVDLSCFDSYLLASHVAQFPLPILTGIGHEQDESIVDMVAHRALKTPTAVADYLIEAAYGFERQLDELQHQIYSLSHQYLSEQKARLSELSQQIPFHLQNVLQQNYYRLQNLYNAIQNVSNQYVNRKQNQLDRILLNISYGVRKTIYERVQHVQSLLLQSFSGAQNMLNQHQSKLANLSTTAELSNPAHILSKGYSIALYNGKPLLRSADIPEEAVFETLLFEGKLTSRVIKKNQ
ncbi:MAG: exodeoxyribonuclease VII large subunit [Bacteroidales bacterium]